MGQKEEVKLGHGNPGQMLWRENCSICVPYWVEMANSMIPSPLISGYGLPQEGHDLEPGDSLQLSQTPERVDRTPPSCLVFLEGGFGQCISVFTTRPVSFSAKTPPSPFSAG